MSQTKEGALKCAAARIGISYEVYTAKVEAGQKRCTVCKQWKAISDFCIDRSRFDGHAAKCFDCSRVKERISTKGRPSVFKGRTHTQEAKQAMSEARKGKPQPHAARPRTADERKKISDALRASPNVLRGPACPAYKDGQLAERRGQRFSVEYKRWRYDVFARDKYTCQVCGDSRGGNLRAHHVKPWADHPELRFDVSNGQTLCLDCHKLVHAKISIPTL